MMLSRQSGYDPLPTVRLNDLVVPLRLLVESMAISRVQLLLDVHVSNSAGAGIPLDTHAAPLTLSPVIASRLLFRPSVVAHGLLAHFVAEALLSAPQMLGSLELLLNPTGASGQAPT